ncbi:FUSC family protein [Algibacter sp. R77976]|uniref:FUSC family protein n=1 Tax=Algibacter sp. R77976 TaxID=3093873 RepID=UPI0037CA696E
MKKLFTILALIASIFAVIFSVLPISNLAIFPAIAALIFGLIAFYLSKKSGQIKKIIQFTFLLTIVALAVTTYKSIFTKTEVVNTELIEAKETELKEASIEELEELDIEIDEEELEGISFE